MPSGYEEERSTVLIFELFFLLSGKMMEIHYLMVLFEQSLKFQAVWQAFLLNKVNQIAVAMNTIRT